MNGTVNGMPFTDPGYPTHFQFPGGAWSEVTAGSIPGDRKSVGSVGPFTLAANDTLCIDLAFPYAHGAGAGPLWSVPDLLQRAAAVQAFYNAQDYACNSTPDIVTAVQAKDEIADVRLFPNPTTDRLTVTGLKPDGLHNFQVFDLAGQLVRTLTAPVNFGQCALRIEGLAEGMYHLTWSSERTGITSKTFVIIR
ncbi:MAG: T9SS type A sorting domain-containing protein [Flavobacteriales bacterium]|nr:T9SS type A sorting domain-containing protein [Flavobacteriales bacterium]